MIINWTNASCYVVTHSLALFYRLIVSVGYMRSATSEAITSGKMGPGDIKKEGAVDAIFTEGMHV